MHNYFFYFVVFVLLCSPHRFRSFLPRDASAERGYEIACRPRGDATVYRPSVCPSGHY